MKLPLHFLFAIAVVILGLGCRGAGSRAMSEVAKSSLDYSKASAWVCLPERKYDPCQRDLSATEVRADGSHQLVRDTTSASPPLEMDCFYVYPTVDSELVPGNHTDFGDPRIANVAHVQAARFREVCSVYVPFYRQVTIGTYLRPRDVLEEGLALAFRDVEAAFHEYLSKFDRGRPLVLIGHSQGAGMINRLLSRFFDGSSEENRKRRARLVVAMPIGNDLHAGAFSGLPLCGSDDEQTGCVLGYRTHLAGSSIKPPPASIPSDCVNPAGATPGKHLLSRAYFPVNERTRGHLRGINADVTTPFILLRDYYTAECTDQNAPAGYRYLAISHHHNDDPRTDPIDYARDFPERGILSSLGLHILDMQFAQGDLIDTIARRGKKKLGYASRSAP